MHLRRTTTETIIFYRSAQTLLMGSSSAAQAFAFAPNFQKGIKAAGRVMVILDRKSKITDPYQPAVFNFVIFILISF